MEDGLLRPSIITRPTLDDETLDRGTDLRVQRYRSLQCGTAHRVSTQADPGKWWTGIFEESTEL